MRPDISNEANIVDRTLELGRDEAIGQHPLDAVLKRPPFDSSLISGGFESSTTRRASGGRPRVVFGFTIADGKIVEIEMVADPERIGQLDLTVLDG